MGIPRAHQGNLFKQEWWRPVVHFPDYEVSNLGRVRRARRSQSNNGSKYGKGYILSERYTGGKDRVNGDGGWKYACVDLYCEGKRTKMRVHRMVARAFIGRSPLGRDQVDHINGDRTVNAAWNLRWTSHLENIEYRDQRTNGEYSYEDVERAAIQDPAS